MNSAVKFDPKFADGGPRKRKPPAGWQEHELLGWTVAVGNRTASVSNTFGDLTMHCGWTDDDDYEPAFCIPVANPSQLLDAMIRADRWVTGGDA